MSFRLNNDVRCCLDLRFESSLSPRRYSCRQSAHPRGGCRGLQGAVGGASGRDLSCHALIVIVMLMERKEAGKLVS